MVGIFITSCFHQVYDPGDRRRGSSGDKANFNPPTNLWSRKYEQLLIKLAAALLGGRNNKEQKNVQHLLHESVFYLCDKLHFKVKVLGTADAAKLKRPLHWNP